MGRDGRLSVNSFNPSLIIIPVRVHDSPVAAMIDTGATHILVTQSFLRTLPSVDIAPTSITSAFLGDASSTIAILGVAHLRINIKHVPTFTLAHVVETLHTDLILGMDWCNANDVRLCVRDQTLQLRHGSHGIVTVPARLAQSITLLPHQEHLVSLYAPLSSASRVSYNPASHLSRTRHIVTPEAVLKITNFHSYIIIYNAHSTACRLKKHTYPGDTSYFSDSCLSISSVSSRPAAPPLLSNINLSSSNPSPSHLTTHHGLDHTLQHLIHHLTDPSHHIAFLDLLHSHSDVFDTSHHSIAKTTIPHAIATGNHPPISVRPYYRTVQQRKDLQSEVDKILLDNVIRPSTSPRSSPVLLKKKPDGTFRFLVDFRRLNAVTKKDCFPQPSAEELLLRLAGHTFFTKLDLKSGYFQIPIATADKEKTAFVTPDGHYEFNILAQGLMNAPPTFQRVMNNLIATGRWDYVVVYLDDIVVFSHIFEEHRRHVGEVLSILQRARFKVSRPKCAIATDSIEFLGHIVSAHTVQPSIDKVQAILAIPSPRTLSQANRFLGKIGYYRKFIPDFARLAAPLHRVSNKTRTRRHEFYWHTEQQDAFEKFKTILTTAPLFLHFPDPSGPFMLPTDASLTRIAGVLKQETATGLHVCYYKSRLLNDVEQRYSATEREALAIYWCLDQLRPYIGSSSIVVETDHKPLLNMHHKPTFHNKCADNWLLKLQDLLPQILAINYRSGIDNVGPDFLTRYDPVELSQSTTAQDTLASASSVSLPSTDPACASPITPAPPTLTCSRETPSLDTIIISPIVTRATARVLQQATSAHSVAPPDQSPTPTSSPDQPPADAATPSHLSLSRIKAAQQQDPPIIRVKQSLLSNNSVSDFVVIDGVLFRDVVHNTTGSFHRLPYLLSSLIATALRLYHDHNTQKSRPNDCEDHR